MNASESTFGDFLFKFQQQTYKTRRIVQAQLKFFLFPLIFLPPCLRQPRASNLADCLPVHGSLTLRLYMSINTMQYCLVCFYLTETASLSMWCFYHWRPPTLVLFSRSIFTHPYRSGWLNCCVTFHFRNIPPGAYPFPSWRVLCCFQILAVTHTTTVNILLCASLCAFM